MQTCKHCRAALPQQASFCGTCGRSQSGGKEAPTSISGPQRPQIAMLDTLPLRNAPDTRAGEDLIKEEEEEEKRRRGALIGFGLPLAAGASGGQFENSGAMVQGSPQVNSGATVQGSPQINGGMTMPPLANTGGSPAPFAMSAGATMPAPPLVLPGPTPFPPPHGSPVPPTPHIPPGPEPPPGPSSPPGPSHPPTPPGCITWLIIIVVPLIILLSIFSAGVTVFAPALSLSGSTSVLLGGTLHLQGSHFIPGSIVTLTLDDSLPLYYSQRQPPAQADRQQAATIGLWMLAAQIRSLPASSNTLTVSGSGTFSVDIAVNQQWKIGPHKIRAAEKYSFRSATSTFTVYAPNQSPTPAPSATATASPGATSTATPTPTPVAGPAAATLNSIVPNDITIGPVNEGYKQVATATVDIKTTGEGPLPWLATWDTNQASWLQLSPTSGQIQAPATQTITLSAASTGLRAGTYSTVVTLSSPKGGPQLALHVTFQVQTGCISATPRSLSFTTQVGANDPPAQRVTLTNCGAAGNWSASVTQGAAWLSASPTSGDLKGGETKDVAVTVTAKNLNLKAGTYQGQIVFTSGQAQFTVMVTLTIQSPPLLVANPTGFSASDSCKFNARLGMWICHVVTLSSNGMQSSINWSSSSNGVKNVIVSPSGGTIAPGQTVPVEIDIPRFTCDTTPVINFSGPANIVAVTVKC